MTYTEEKAFIWLLCCLNALSNEAVAYVRDRSSDGRHLISAANNAAECVKRTSSILQGEYVL